MNRRSRPVSSRFRLLERHLEAADGLDLLRCLLGEQHALVPLLELLQGGARRPKLALGIPEPLLHELSHRPRLRARELVQHVEEHSGGLFDDPTGEDRITPATGDLEDVALQRRGDRELLLEARDGLVGAGPLDDPSVPRDVPHPLQVSFGVVLELPPALLERPVRARALDLVQLEVTNDLLGHGPAFEHLGEGPARCLVGRVDPDGKIEDVPSRVPARVRSDIGPGPHEHQRGGSVLLLDEVGDGDHVDDRRQAQERDGPLAAADAAQDLVEVHG